MQLINHSKSSTHHIVTLECSVRFGRQEKLDTMLVRPLICFLYSSNIVRNSEGTIPRYIQRQSYSEILTLLSERMLSIFQNRKNFR